MSCVTTATEGLDELIERLPAAARAMLACGPVDEESGPFGCQVCNALDSLVSAREPIAEILFDFHDVDDREGGECYERCLAIYRAAGWQG